MSKRAESREWLESTLLSLEEQGLLDITRERTPPHYHVALFPEPYMAHVARLEARERADMVAPAASGDELAAVASPLLAPDRPAAEDGSSQLAALLSAVMVVVGAFLMVRRRPELMRPPRK